MAKLIALLLFLTLLFPGVVFGSTFRHPSRVICTTGEMQQHKLFELPIVSGLIRTTGIDNRLDRGYVVEHRTDGTSRGFFPPQYAECVVEYGPEGEGE